MLDREKLFKRLRIAFLFALLGPAIGAACGLSVLLFMGGSDLSVLPSVFLFGYIIGVSPALATGVFYAAILPRDYALFLSPILGASISALMSAIVFSEIEIALAFCAVAGAVSALACAKIAQIWRWDELRPSPQA